MATTINVKQVENLGTPRSHEIRFPTSDNGLDQDEEWCQVLIDGQWEKVRFHEYDRIYDVPSLYEDLFYNTLQCSSPERVVRLLASVLEEQEHGLESLRVLDVGAGNGIVGEELTKSGVPYIIGADIIPEARRAALRDRPDVYDRYFVEDLCDLPEEKEKTLRSAKLNCLTTVAALGFGDIPPMAFLQAVDLIETPGWMAFNVKEEFLRESDSTGFSRLIRHLSREENIQIQAYWRYRHRLSLEGEPLYYVAVVARKLRDVSDELREAFR